MKYFERIDGLRFIAIFFVLIEHFAFSIGKHITAGYYGVDLFFVISGFLITTILIKPSNDSFKRNYINFLGRRTLRIFPIYYLSILILWLLNLPVVHDQLIWLLTYTFNYAKVIYDIKSSPVGHFWSLSVEEQFYIFWPIIVVTLKNKLKILLSTIIILIALGYAQMYFDIFPSLSKFNDVGILTRMSSLALGALGSVLAAYKVLPKKIFQSKYVEYLVFTVFIVSLLSDYKIKFLILGFISLYFVLKSAYFKFSFKLFDLFLRNKKVINIGLISYGIYLFHKPFEYYFTSYIFDPVWLNIDFSSLGIFEKIRWHSWVIKFPIYSFLTIIIAKLSFKYIESPILKLKDKFFKYNK